MRLARRSLLLAITFLSALLISASLSQAQQPPAPAGTVTWSANYPAVMNAPRSGAMGAIKFLGTQTPAPGWTFKTAYAYHRLTNGGALPPGNGTFKMDEKAGAIGTLNVANQTIGECQVGCYPTAYTCWMECSYFQQGPGGLPVPATVSSSVQQVTVQ